MEVFISQFLSIFVNVLKHQLPESLTLHSLILLWGALQSGPKKNIALLVRPVQHPEGTSHMRGLVSVHQVIIELEGSWSRFGNNESVEGRVVQSCTLAPNPVIKDS